MTKILLICSAGMSTSFMVEKMKKSAENKNIEVEINAVPEAIAFDYVGKVDAVLLGPQVKYLESKIKDMFEGVPVKVINMVHYGTMNGEAVLEDVLNIIGG